MALTIKIISPVDEVVDVSEETDSLSSFSKCLLFLANTAEKQGEVLLAKRLREQQEELLLRAKEIKKKAG